MSGRCEDYPCCGHTDGLPCDWTPDYESIWAHIGCEHEAGYCVMEDRDEEIDPEDCEHRNAYMTGTGAWCCDDCLADLVMVTHPSVMVYVSAVVPGLTMSIPVLGWHWRAAA